MEKASNIKNEIQNFLDDKEKNINIYVMRCFSIAMFVYFVAFLLNFFDIFIIDKQIMQTGFIPSMIIYFAVLLITKCVSLSDRRIKYFILFSVICVFTLIGVTITYHVVVIALLPILYGTLYSSKKVLWYVYGLTVISTIITVYVGYYFGLCDANMALLTSTKLDNYVVDGVFTLTTINNNPAVTLMIFYVIPRCLIHVAFIVICNSIFRMIEESQKKAAEIAKRESLEIQKAEMEKEKAEAASKAKSTFLSSMSHEIRTPMNAIVGMTEVLLRGEHSDETKDYLNNIKVSGEALLTIINDILDFSKIESGKMDIVENTYNPVTMINDLKMVFENRVLDKPIELIYQVDDNIAERLRGDEHRLRQIIINLVNNAIKFTDNGYVKLSVESKAIDDNKVELTFKVEDTGMGIKEEEMSKLFSSFEQLDVKKNYAKEGTGLGLAISKQLVNLMDGKIGVESQYGKGSTFYFSVPQTIATDETDEVENTGEHEGSVDISKMNYTMSAARILLVDDNEMNIKVTKALLEPFKMCITTANNGKEAVDLVSKNQYDLVFMDHMMPVMDGIEATKTIRKFKGEYYCELPIIALTANVTEEARTLFAKANMNDFVAKPIQMDEIARCLLKWLPNEVIEVQTESAVQEDAYTLEENAEALPVIEGLDVNEGIKNCGSKEVFLDLVKDFYKLIDSKSLKIETCLNEDKIREYTIEVHALKSTARMVGAMELSALAYELEKLGNENAKDEIESKTPELLRLYRSYKVLLEEYGKTGEEATVKVSVSQIKETLMRIHDAMDSFDLDEADKAMGELKGYEFPEEMKEMVEELSVFLADVAIEDVIRVTEEMCERLSSE